MTSNVGSSYCVLRKDGTTLIANGVVADDSGAAMALLDTVVELAEAAYVEFGIRVSAASKNLTDAGTGVDPSFIIQFLGA
jgi:hypothetical protein